MTVMIIATNHIRSQLVITVVNMELAHLISDTSEIPILSLHSTPIPNFIFRLSMEINLKSCSIFLSSALTPWPLYPVCDL